MALKPIRLSELVPTEIVPAPAINLKEFEAKDKKTFKAAVTTAKSIAKDCEKHIDALTEVMDDRESTERSKMVAKLLLAYFEDTCTKMGLICQKIGERDEDTGDSK